MSRPPVCVAFVAKTHGMVGGVIAVSAVVLALLLQRVPRIEVATNAYYGTAALAAFYLLTSALVWFGRPLGQLCSRVCTLLYLARPNFGSPVWETMNTPEFKAHFIKRPKDDAPLDASR